jgi:hypothetical protein
VEFKQDISTFIDEARRALPKAFESEDYVSKRQQALGHIEEEKAKIIQQINESAQKQGFVIQMGPTGLMIIPAREGRPLSEEEFNALTERERKRSRIRDRRLTATCVMGSVNSEIWMERRQNRSRALIGMYLSTPSVTWSPG